MQLERLGVYDETRRIVLMPDGSLAAFFLSDAGGMSGGAPQAGSTFTRMMRATSTDHGTTWTEPVEIFRLPTDRGFWYGWDAIVDDGGEVNLFTLHDRGTGVGGIVIGEGDKNCQKLFGTCLDMWHLRSSAGGKTWDAGVLDYGDDEPGWNIGVRSRAKPQAGKGGAGGIKCIWKGYTGSLNSVIQIKSGRIVLAFSYMTKRTWFDRSPGLDNFTYHGMFACSVVYSDDHGTTWGEGTKDLEVWVPEPTNTYGAVEPVLLEMKDGRVWMVIRAQTGRLYESFSADGANWSKPRPYDVWSSDSPVGLSRLPDGRIVMIWNCCLRYPYAFGGRQVLHAAISEDEGKTWIGVRECIRDPKRLEPPPTVGGDFGTAYPYNAVTADNRVILSSGQGKGRVQTVRIDPAWLYVKAVRSEFEDAEEWQTFGTAGIGIIPHPQAGTAKPQAAKALRITKVQPGPTATAVWNFPSGQTGVLTLRLRAEAGAKALRVSLSDHFSAPFDIEDDLWALFNFHAEAKDAGWHTLELAWDTAKARACLVRLDGREVAVLPLEHRTRGACYLRLVSVPEGLGEASDIDTAGWWLESVSVEVG